MSFAPPLIEPTRLMLDHAHALLGTFITSVTMVKPGHWKIRSATFPNEVDWNVDLIDWNVDVIEPTGIGQTAEVSTAPLWVATFENQGVQRRHHNRRARVLGTEHWLRRDLRLDPPTTQTLLSLSDKRTTATHSSRPSNSFCDVFRDAFALTSHEDQAYRTAFLTGHSPADVQTNHLVLDVDGEPVAIGSLHCTPSTSFLYNVGTRPGHRGQGYASRAVTELLTAGHARAETVWLQCLPDSGEERLYHGLKFHTMFAAHLLPRSGRNEGSQVS